MEEIKSEEVKTAVAKNLVALRTVNGMTQAEFAAKLNYSDKAVSKWERGESLPDIAVLYSISKMFHVTLDELVSGEPSVQKPPVADKEEIRRHNTHLAITVISSLSVWLVATIVFVLLIVISPGIPYAWLSFLYALPVCATVWLVLNSVFLNPRQNYLIVSILVWGVLVSLVITLEIFNIRSWPLYLLGIPGQLIIIVSSLIGKKK